MVRWHDAESVEPGRRLQRIIGWLRSRDDVRIIGPSDPELRAPTVSIIPQKKSISELFPVLTEHKLMLSSGNFYAVRPLLDMNIPLNTGVLRFSFIHYTTEAEIEQLIGGLKAALD